ncbi:hypothetical protein JCM8208_003116 [Rhodotorula glutinis]
MVLQDKYARAASRKYARNHAPTADEAADHAAVDAALREAEGRRLGTNADRYREDDEERARELGLAPPREGDDEVDEEEERRKVEEQEQLDAFLSRQRDKLASPSDAPGEHDEDEDDVDHSFAHLRIGGNGRMRPPPGGHKTKVETVEDKEELRRMQDEARRMQAVRDLKDRFSGSAPRSAPPPSTRPPPAASSRPSGPSATTAAPTKPIVRPAAQGQDFLDTLL